MIGVMCLTHRGRDCRTRIQDLRRERFDLTAENGWNRGDRLCLARDAAHGQFGRRGTEWPEDNRNQQLLPASRLVPVTHGLITILAPGGPKREPGTHRDPPARIFCFQSLARLSVRLRTRLLTDKLANAAHELFDSGVEFFVPRLLLAGRLPQNLVGFAQTRIGLGHPAVGLPLGLGYPAIRLALGIGHSAVRLAELLLRSCVLLLSPDVRFGHRVHELGHRPIQLCLVGCDPIEHSNHLLHLSFKSLNPFFEFSHIR